MPLSLEDELLLCHCRKLEMYMRVRRKIRDVLESKKENQEIKSWTVASRVLLPECHFILLKGNQFI